MYKGQSCSLWGPLQWMQGLWPSLAPTGQMCTIAYGRERQYISFFNADVQWAYMVLYIVSTPIGNLGDISYRGLEVLKEADVICAEDTRRTKVLLKKYGIGTHMISYHDHNKEKVTPKIIAELQKQKNVALVSDAGTPGVSDPGFYLIRRAILEGIQVVPVPGASAVLAALVSSGLPTDKFCFLGFLPKGKEKIKKAIKDMPSMTRIFYESPHRILKTLSILKEVIPDKQLVIAREITKLHEEFIRGSVKEVYEAVKNRKLKGEMVLVIGR